MIWGTPCVLHVKTAFDVVGFVIQLGSISTIVSLFLITFMQVRRYLQTQRKRDQWKAEIEQARQVQHVLIPDELPRIAGFTIESELSSGARSTRTGSKSGGRTRLSLPSTSKNREDHLASGLSITVTLGGFPGLLRG